MIAIVKDRAERDNRSYRARWAWPNTSKGGGNGLFVA